MGGGGEACWHCCRPLASPVQAGYMSFTCIRVQGCCMVDVSGHRAFSASELPKALEAAEADAKAGSLKPAQLFAFDHVMEGSGKQGKHSQPKGASQNGEQ